jgi:signal transduction histidine kinase
MHEVDLLRLLRSQWIAASVSAIAETDAARQDLEDQLSQFFDILCLCVESCDPHQLDHLMSSWAQSLTTTDLEGITITLTRLIATLQQQTAKVILAELSPEEGNLVLSKVLEYFAHAFSEAASNELEVKVKYITAQLDDTRSNLEKLEKSKSDFIAVAAHELKTPLTLVEGYTAMLREGLDPVSAPNAIVMTDGIINGAKRLRTIIDDMIDVSLIDNRMLMLNQQPVWINRLFQAIQTEFASTLLERDQKMLVEDFPGSNEVIFGDPERLLQVFRNVVLNAIKFTPDHGHIWIGGRQLPGFLEVSITDDGIGIDADDQTMIFQRFSRVGNAALHSSGKTKYKGGGPGLGLHIAKGIIEAHGGAIWAESAGHDEINRPGSTFHILIPATQSPIDEKTARLFSTLTK